MSTLRLTASMAALFTAIALGAAAAHAQEVEEIKIVFEQAIPNIPGKSLVAQVVSYPQAPSLRPIAMSHQRILCPSCRGTIAIPPGATAGKTLRCPLCETRFAFRAGRSRANKEGSCARPPGRSRITRTKSAPWK